MSRLPRSRRESFGFVGNRWASQLQHGSRRERGGLLNYRTVLVENGGALVPYRTVLVENGVVITLFAHPLGHPIRQSNRPGQLTSPLPPRWVWLCHKQTCFSQAQLRRRHRKSNNWQLKQPPTCRNSLCTSSSFQAEILVENGETYSITERFSSRTVRSTLYSPTHSPTIFFANPIVLDMSSPHKHVFLRRNDNCNTEAPTNALQLNPRSPGTQDTLLLGSPGRPG